MSKVLFVTPVFEPTISEECRGTLLLATILKQNGFDVDIYRYFESHPEERFNTFIDNSVKNILAKEPVLVSFYCRGDCYLANIMIAKKLKEIRSEIIIVFGGPQADVAAVETLQQIPWVDYCCSGEGETTIIPLFSALLKGEDATAIRGLSYRDSSGNVISNPRPELIKDLDTLPFYDYSLLSDSQIENIKTSDKMFMLEVGRGCPFNCAYCSTSLFWQRRFRLKSPQRILEEMKQLNKDFGVTSFSLDHDLFTANKKSVLEFCRVIKESRLGFSWGCSSRADTLDPELIKEMASAGMNGIFLGIESGSPRMQTLIHKKLNIERSVEIVKCLIDNNVRVTASFMYGFPEETYDDVEQTMQMIYTLYQYRVGSLQFHLCSIFPGTEYFDVYKDKLVWAETTSDHTGDFGLQENIDFIQSHRDVFPFYYEYQSELRTRLNSLGTTFIRFMDMYRQITQIDTSKFAGKRMVDLYLDFKDANAEALKKYTSIQDCKEHDVELFINYLSTVYDEEYISVLKDIFTFRHDSNELMMSNEENATEVKIYNADIKAFLRHDPIESIKPRTSMVYFNKVDKELSYRIQYLD